MGKGIIYILGLFGIWEVTGRTKYDNYNLMTITPRNIQEFKDLKYFVETFSEETDDVNIFQWSHGPDDSTDILVSPGKIDKFLRFLKKNGMPFRFEEHYEKHTKRPNTSLHNTMFQLYSYNSYGLIREHLKELPGNKGKIQVDVIGKSYEGRKLYLVKMSADRDAKNPIIFISAGMHAREWAAISQAMYIINRLKSTARAELNGVDWYILPVVNPDGYEHSRKDESFRLWRKSRSYTKEPGCFGVDLNRNFDYKWGTTGASFNPCSDIFAGRKAFCEKETKIFRDVLHKYSKRIKVFVDIHTYGDYLIHPWSYTGDFMPSEWKDQHDLAQKFSDAVVEAGGNPLKVLSAGQWYPVSGTAMDYAHGVVKIPFAYVLEITRHHDFTFPEEKLRTILPQYFEGFRALAKAVRRKLAHTKDTANNKLKITVNQSHCHDWIHLCNK